MGADPRPNTPKYNNPELYTRDHCVSTLWGASSAGPKIFALSNNTPIPEVFSVLEKRAKLRISRESYELSPAVNGGTADATS